MADIKKNEEFFVKYSSPAFPPDGLDANTKYLYGKDNIGEYIYINGEKEYKKSSYIRGLFLPVDGGWK